MGDFLPIAVHGDRGRKSGSAVIRTRQPHFAGVGFAKRLGPGNQYGAILRESYFWPVLSVAGYGLGPGIDDYRGRPVGALIATAIKQQVIALLGNRQQLTVFGECRRAGQFDTNFFSHAGHSRHRCLVFRVGGGCRFRQGRQDNRQRHGGAQCAQVRHRIHSQ